MDLVSPHPFWLLQNGLLGIYPSLRANLRCDVLVLGAGISGALVSERLAREGFNVAVIDKRDAGAGSTSASTALLQYEIDTPLTDLAKLIGQRDAERAYRLCHDSIDVIERLAIDAGLAGIFQRRPSTCLAVKDSEREQLQQECSARKAIGIEVEYMESAEIAARFSFTRPAALFSTQAAQIDAHRLTHALLRRASEHGARIFDHTCAAEIEPEEHGVRLKTDRGCVVNARHVIFATGYESQEYLPKRIVQLKSTFATASEPLESFPGWWEQSLIWETARPYLYLRTTADRRALIGGEDIPFRNPAHRDRLVEKKASILTGRFNELFPQIEFTLDHSWAGTFGETKDGLAYIGQARQMPRCLFALGFGGNGITYSAIAAEILFHILKGDPAPDARLFRFDR